MTNGSVKRIVRNYGRGLWMRGILLNLWSTFLLICAALFSFVLFKSGHTWGGFAVIALCLTYLFISWRSYVRWARSGVEAENFNLVVSRLRALKRTKPAPGARS
jgi:hypothetical protein